MNNLYISITNDISFISITKDDIIFINTIEQNQACEKITNQFQDLLQKSKIKIENLNNIILNIGPGNFTSIRIVVAFAAGIRAIFDKINIITLTANDILYSSIQNFNKLNNNKIITIFASNNILYYQIFNENRNQINDILIADLDEIKKQIENYKIEIITSNINLKIDKINFIKSEININNMIIAENFFKNNKMLKQHELIKPIYYKDPI